MTARKPTPSPASLARADRQRLEAEEGARAIAEVERDATAIRKNMERLRVLREAKEAEEAEAVKTEITGGNTAAKTKRKKRIST